MCTTMNDGSHFGSEGHGHRNMVSEGCQSCHHVEPRNVLQSSHTNQYISLFSPISNLSKETRMLTHSQHCFLAPSSKLCQIWLCH